MKRPITVVTFSPISLVAEVEQVEHGSKLMGRNVIYVDPTCTKYCEWCEAAKARCRSRFNPESWTDRMSKRRKHEAK